MDMMKVLSSLGGGDLASVGEIFSKGLDTATASLDEHRETNRLLDRIAGILDTINETIKQRERI